MAVVEALMAKTAEELRGIEVMLRDRRRRAEGALGVVREAIKVKKAEAKKAAAERRKAAAERKKEEDSRPSPKRTGITRLGVSSHSVSGFPTLFGQKAPKRTGMTRLGFPGLSSAACPNSRKKASKRPLVARSQKAASFNSNSHIGKPLVCRGPESRQKASQRPLVAVASFISNSHMCWETAF